MQSAVLESELPLARLSVAQYHAMQEAGILGDEDRIELLEGLLVPKTTKRPPHRLATGLVRKALERIVPAGHYVDSQEPITTADSEPEPDAVVVRGARRDYADRHPGAENLVLVVEVADESLERDRTIELAAYTRASIAVYWIVNLRSRALEVYSEPVGARYQRGEEFPAGTIVPLRLGSSEIGSVAVDELLP